MALTEQEQKELQTLLELEALDTCKESAQHFIENYVKIEDRDKATDDSIEGIAAPFTLWPLQLDVLNNFLVQRLLIVLKARQLGLSWLALAYAVWRIVFFSGYQVVALSKREEDAKELVRRVKFILKNLPDFMIQEKKYAQSTWKGSAWETTALSITIHHPNKQEPSVFNSMTSAPDSGRSFTANLVILDEWAFQQWAEQIWSAAYPTINRPSGGQVIGISTAKIGTLFEETWHMAVKGANQFKGIFLPWWTDPRRTPEWYEQTKKDLPHSYLQEYPSTAEEAFSAGEATAFPEFSIEVHVCKPFPIPEHWRKWASVDNGYDDPFAFYWSAVSEDGTVYIYREFTREKEEPKLIYSDQATEFMERCKFTAIEDGEAVDKIEKLDYIVAGLDAWHTHVRDISGKNLIDYYMDGGIKYGFIKAVTDRKLGKATVHEYLKPYVDENTGKWTAKLQIFDTCTKLIETLPQLPKDDKNPEKVADCSIDHCFDSLRYNLLAYHVAYTKPVEPETPLIRSHKDRIAKNSQKFRRKLM
ncbi:MAG TPA: hypothetical protein VFD33_04555 [Bacillota bacterium]|nr:hypothetical protein [Bacillota bacterium]